MKKIRFDYNDWKYNLRDDMCWGLNIRKPEYIHEMLDYTAPTKAGEDSRTPFHKLFYKNYPTLFMFSYRRVIKDYIVPLYNEPILVQKIPSFRLHMPDSLAVAEFHRDSDFGHSEKEVNYYLPMTAAYDTNTFWIESEPGKINFAPVEAVYGEIVEFNGATLKHGNFRNTTGITRASIDFRVIREQDYVDSGNKSIQVGTKFTIGENGYWQKAHLL